MKAKIQNEQVKIIIAGMLIIILYTAIEFISQGRF